MRNYIILILCVSLIAPIFLIPREIYISAENPILSIALADTLKPPQEALEASFEPVIVPPSVPAILEKIAFCESGGNQYHPDGRVIRGRVDPRDIGKYQINLYYHQKTSEDMGLDVFKEQDNETFALHLYNTQGTKPWEASRGCWSRL